jgi:ABC-type uncharacterized transport system substrate-binding protein
MTFPSSAKRLALLHELVPRAAVIAVLQDPKFVIHETETREIETAVRAMGLEIITVKAATEQEINAAFSTVARSGAGALLVGGGPFFNARRNQLIGLAALHAIPASYFERGFVDAGGLISYGASQTDAYRRAGAPKADIAATQQNFNLRLPQNLRQLGDIRRNSAGLPGYTPGAGDSLFRGKLLPIIGWTEVAFEFVQGVAK